MSWLYKKTSTILKHDVRVIDTQVVNFYIVHTNYKILFFEFNSKQLRSDYDPKKQMLRMNIALLWLLSLWPITFFQTMQSL